jgi:sigma-B regulation protein RsbU (phosphoserine phosphatase)
MSDVTTEKTGETAARMQCMEVWGGNRRVDRSFDMPGLQTWVYSRPFGDSDGGGDVYYVSSCASGRITRLLLADVSGHGAEVSDLALGLRELMRKNVNYVKQKRFIEGMNRQFTRLSESGSFATAIVATFFQPTHRMTLCNAGHPSPLHYDSSQGTWSRIDPPPIESADIAGVPLGVYDGTSYPQQEIALNSGDMVLLFSDALTESRDEHGRMRGEGGVLELLSKYTVESPRQLLSSLVAKVDEGHADSGAADDLTIVLTKANESSTTLVDNLLAAFRLLRPVTDNTSLVTAEPGQA